MWPLVLGAETGGSVGAGISFGTGVGIPFIREKLPEGLIGPAPPLKDAGDSSALGEFFEQALAQGSQGVSSVVAGEAIPAGQDGEVFYKIEAANGSVDEYRLYQTVVDPAAAITETAGNNDDLDNAQDITASLGTLINGTFEPKAAPTDPADIDVYKFTASAADIGKQFVVIIDTDPTEVLSNLDPEDDVDAARPEIQVGFREFSFVEPRRLGSTTTFSDGTALGPFDITRAWRVHHPHREQGTARHHGGRAVSVRRRRSRHAPGSG